jgi:hypothetical protein
VECRHPQVAGLVFSDKLAYAVAHLGCGLVGEWQRQDPPWGDTVRNEIGDPVGQHAGLT